MSYAVVYTAPNVIVNISDENHAYFLISSFWI